MHLQALPVLPGAGADVRFELGHVGLRRAAAVAAQRHLEQRLGRAAVDRDAPVRLQVGAHRAERQQEGRGEAVPVLLGLQPVRVKVLRGARAVGPGLPGPGSCAARLRRAASQQCRTVRNWPATCKAPLRSPQQQKTKGLTWRSGAAARILHWPA